MERITVKHRVSYDALVLHNAVQLENMIRDEMTRRMSKLLIENNKYKREVEELEESNCRQYEIEAYFCSHDELIHVKQQLKSIADCCPQIKDKCLRIWDTLAGNLSLDKNKDNEED